ncbi:MAG: endonuclease/exonuclease/phosphatase family protein [Ilumatobacteraceae bacterium]
MADAWTIATWNLHGSAGPDLVEVAARIESMAADVVVAQEMKRHQARVVSRHLGWHHVWRRKHYPWSVVMWWRAEGLAILSPHRLSSPQRVVLSRRTRHWSYRNRIMLSATVHRRDASALRIHDVHLSSDDADERIDQARRAVEIVVREGRCVVAGDLNGDDEVEVLREFRVAGLDDAGGDATSPSHVPTAHLDRVLVPTDAVVRATSVPDADDRWTRLSDHLPLVVSVLL